MITHSLKELKFCAFTNRSSFKIPKSCIWSNSYLYIRCPIIKFLWVCMNTLIFEHGVQFSTLITKCIRFHYVSFHQHRFIECGNVFIVMLWFKNTLSRIYLTNFDHLTLTKCWLNSNFECIRLYINSYILLKIKVSSFIVIFMSINFLVMIQI